MDWYYAAGGKQAGPVSDTALADLVRTGAIKAETLVWNSALPNWVPYIQVAAPAAAAAPVEAAPAAPAAAGAMPFCSECGRPFSPNDMVAFGDRWICANCKEVFTQKLREGVAPAGGLHYAGFWIRFLAVVIDGIILYIVSRVVNRVLSISANPTDIFGGMALVSLALLIQIALACTYEGIFVGQYGATPGKMALGLKVVMPDGSRVSMGRAFGRYFAKLLSSLTLLIGYIIAGFDVQKRALHDYICNTRVIRSVR